MTFELWIALAFANLLVGLTPGQNVALLGAAITRSGVSGGLYAITGILASQVIWSCAALALAISAKELSPNIFYGLQVLSGVFLLWVGFDLLRSTAQPTEQQRTKPQRKAAWLMMDGFWIGLANPLMLVFFITLFPNFMPEQTLAITSTMIAFYVSAVLISTAAAKIPYFIASYALATAGLSRFLQRGSGTALLGLGGMVILKAAV